MIEGKMGTPEGLCFASTVCCFVELVSLLHSVYPTDMNISLSGKSIMEAHALSVMRESHVHLFGNAVNGSTACSWACVW